MKAITTVMAACILSLHANAGAQQTGTPEDEESQGIPATPHQEQAAREVDSDLFKKLDQNRDGSISQQEAQADASLSGRWNDLDGNGDGTLDEEEFAGFHASSTSSAGSTEADMPTTPHQEHAVQGDLIEQLDEDGDGKISEEEAAAEARLSDNWDRMDRNRDGQLDSSELERGEQ